MVYGYSGVGVIKNEKYKEPELKKNMKQMLGGVFGGGGLRGGKTVDGDFSCAIMRFLFAG